MLLKELCELNGVSGDEKKVRDFIREQIKAKADAYTIDKIGNLVAVKNSRSPNRPQVLLCAHMDEVGLFITEITGDGYLKFQPVGGIDPRILIAKPVTINGSLPGVIGAKAVHLQKKEERKQSLTIEELYIDIGANCQEEAEKEVKPGDYAAFASTFSLIGEGFYKGKALDDRVGCALLLDLMSGTYPCELLAAFTVQEEVGLRGSKVVGNYLQPDLAIIVEATRAADLQENNEEEWLVTLGKGPACSLMDAATIYQPELIRKVAAIAAANELRLQFRQSTAAANDAGNIQQAATGVPTITLSVPCRNIHGMNSLIAKADYEAAFQLLQAILQNIDVFFKE
jgi:putative aminopeptidase FrvX